MKKIFNIFGLLLTLTTFGQNENNVIPKTNVYGNIFNLTRIDTISESMILGSFYTSNGYCGSYYQFDTSLQFKQNNHCCTWDSIINNGRWQIRTNNTVVLKSNKALLTFYLIRLNNSYFLIPQDQSQIFITDLQETVIKVNKKKPFKKLEGIKYRSLLAFHILSRKYYLKEIR